MMTYIFLKQNEWIISLFIHHSKFQIYKCIQGVYVCICVYAGVVPGFSHAYLLKMFIWNHAAVVSLSWIQHHFISEEPKNILEYTSIFFVTLEITIRHTEQSTDGVKIISTSTGCTMDSVWWNRCAIYCKERFRWLHNHRLAWSPRTAVSPLLSRGEWQDSGWTAVFTTNRPYQ